MNINSTCPIWGTPATELKRDLDERIIDSLRAGSRYLITELAEIKLNRCDCRHKVRLTTWLVEQRRLGDQCPRISQKTIDDAEQCRDMAVADRADAILKHLARKTQTLGAGG